MRINPFWSVRDFFISLWLTPDHFTLADARRFYTQWETTWTERGEKLYPQPFPVRTWAFHFTLANAGPFYPSRRDVSDRKGLKPKRTYKHKWPPYQYAVINKKTSFDSLLVINVTTCSLNSFHGYHEYHGEWLRYQTILQRNFGRKWLLLVQLDCTVLSLVFSRSSAWLKAILASFFLHVSVSYVKRKLTEVASSQFKEMENKRRWSQG